MQVREVMTQDPVCCSRTTSVRNAARTLREFDVGILPVVDEATRKLIGVVTDRDLCLAALGGDHDPTLTTVEDCMAAEPVTCTPETDVREVVGIMGERKIRRIPVVDPDNTVCGIIGIYDLVRNNAFAPAAVCRLLGRIMSPARQARAQAA